MTIANLKRICIEPATYAQELLDRAEAAEATAAELRAEVKRLTGKLEAVVATLDAANDELHATQDMNKSLLSQLDTERARLAIHRGEYHQEWQAETPLGQMLDGIGDEVEP